MISTQKGFLTGNCVLSCSPLLRLGRPGERTLIMLLTVHRFRCSPSLLAAKPRVLHASVVEDVVVVPLSLVVVFQTESGSKGKALTKLLAKLDASASESRVTASFSGENEGEPEAYPENDNSLDMVRFSLPTVTPAPLPTRNTDGYLSSISKG